MLLHHCLNEKMFQAKEVYFSFCAITIIATSDCDQIIYIVWATVNDTNSSFVISRIAIPIEVDSASDLSLPN